MLLAAMSVNGLKLVILVKHLKKIDSVEDITDFNINPFMPIAAKTAGLF